MGGTTLLGTGAINPAIPAGILGGAALYTDPVQNALTFLLTQRPQAAQAVANALRQSTPALVALVALVEPRQASKTTMARQILPSDQINDFELANPWMARLSENSKTLLQQE